MTDEQNITPQTEDEDVEGHAVARQRSDAALAGAMQNRPSADDADDVEGHVRVASPDAAASRSDGTVAGPDTLVSRSDAIADGNVL